MNEVLITNWNHRIKEEDTVYHNGDFCFRNSAGGKEGEGMIHKASYWIKQLNGNIIFIRGNHDRNNSLKTILERVTIKYGTHYINITHIPENYDSRYQINFVGHIHDKWKFKRIYNPIDDTQIDLINIGVDVWGYQPRTFEEIMTSYKNWLRTGKKK